MPPNNSVGFTIKAVDQASATVEKVRLSVGDLAKGFTVGALATDAIRTSLHALRSIVTDSIRAWEEQENAMAQTEAVLKSTGGAAGISSQELYKLASSLQATTTYGDETILSAENLLLTFTSIGSDIFPAATATVLDMSTALGQDLKSSAVQLGKALQDPILGVTALRRVGVNFNEAQADVIKNLVQTGQSAKAQQLIMAELAKEFGGSATAAAKTFAGQMQQVKNKVDDVQETVGHGLTGALSAALIAFNKTTDAMDSNVDVSMKVFNALAFVTETTATVAAGIHLVAGGFVIASSYIGQAIAMLNGFDEAEKVFWASFREEVSSGTKASYDFALNLKEQNAQTRADWDKVTEASKKFGAAAPDAYEATAEAAKQAAQKIEDANKAINDTKQKIQDLMDGNVASNEEAEQKIADAIVEQQHKVHDIKVQIAQATKGESTSILRDQLEQEEAALDRMSLVSVALASQVSEAKRRYALTDFERSMEDMAKQLVADNAAFNRKLKELKDELAANVKKRAEIAVNEIGITTDTQLQLNARDAAVKQSVNNQIREYQRLSSSSKAASPLGLSTKDILTSTRKVNDAIITPSGQVIETHPNDYLIATKTPFGGSGSTINLSVNVGTLMANDDATVEAFGNQLVKILQREQRVSIQ